MAVAPARPEAGAGRYCRGCCRSALGGAPSNVTTPQAILRLYLPAARAHCALLLASVIACICPGWPVQLFPRILHAPSCRRHAMANTVTPPPRYDSPGGKPAPSKKRESDATPEGKPKRTRTGCLTCRERHLKCDETKPTCNNCLKSQRDCSWGKKLNFLDTTCEKNAYLIPKGIDYQIAFQDESRSIAGEYVGGREMYPVEDMESMSMAGNSFSMGPPDRLSMSASARQQHLPPIQSVGSEAYSHPQHSYSFDQRPTSRHHTRARKLRLKHLVQLPLPSNCLAAIRPL